MPATSADQGAVVAETHGCTANRLQIVSSLIKHRLRRAAGAEARRDLVWLLDAVTALGLLHDRLGAGGDADFAGYLREVGLFWRRTVEDRNIAVEVDASDLPVPAAKATTLALIAHELVGNAVEHAFPDGAGGRIEITLKPANGRGAELAVIDHGKGFEQTDRDASMGGLNLARQLAAQLGGSFDIDTRHSTKAMVVFPVG